MKRDDGKLDARLEAADLGQILVTMPEQTAFDLPACPKLGSTPQEAHAAVEKLRPQIDPARFRALLAMKRWNAAVHEFEQNLDRSLGERSPRRHPSPTRLAEDRRKSRGG